MNKWLLILLERLVTVASPHIRDALCIMLRDMEQQAKETDNPWDDILVGILQVILACPDK